LLERHRDDLVRFAERHGGLALRHESGEDLVQGILLRALAAAGGLEIRSEKEFLGWLYAVARAHLADRRDHWTAQKRGPANLLRLTADGAGTSDPRAVAAPAAQQKGPSTAASEAEQVALALRALSLLSPRDRDLVRWESEGATIDECAQRLGVSYDAAQRAHHRAVQRFRKTFQALAGGGEGPGGAGTARPGPD